MTSKISSELPLSLQIYKAHAEWNDRQHEYRVIETQRGPLFSKRVLELLEEGKVKSVARGEREVEASDWWLTYLNGLVEAEYQSNQAKSKYRYLVDLALEQREESYHERFTAKL